MKSLPFPAPGNQFLIEHVSLLADSYQQLLGVPLLDRDLKGIVLAERLFNAPFALVSHNTEQDPVFNYANKTALRLFEFSWRDFTTLPSRLSAEAVNRQEREQLLAQVTAQGYIKNYQGVRVSKSGRKFLISNAVVWNVYAGPGDYRGQAACFRDWTFLN